MKYHIMTLSFIIIVAHGVLMAQTSSPNDRIAVPLTDPSRPAVLKVGLISGSITVKGYSGKEVLVDGRLHRDSEDEDKEDSDEQEEGKEPKSKRIKGLRLIPNTSTGLTVEEEDNVVDVGASGAGGYRTIDITIQVPVNTSMKLHTVNDGDIDVSGTNGDIEVSNTNGSIGLSQISGSVVADAINGDIMVEFVRVNPERSMSFSSLNGTIDVTFPPNTKATVRMKNEQGEIYSDFDVKMENTGTTKVEDKGKHGRYRVTVEKMMKGTINGGGADVQFKNFNGDIYIRKGK